MKKVLIQLLLICFYTNLFAQEGKKQQLESLGPVLYHPTVNNSRKATLMDCSPLTLTGCNFIRNNNFIPNIPPYVPSEFLHFTNPFGMPGDIDFWERAHGSAQIFDGIYPGGTMSYPLPPVGITGYAFSGAGNIGNQINYSEGIVQKIPNIVAGRSYCLSFYRAKKGYANSTPLDFFHIRLITCADYNTYFHANPNDPWDFTIPTIPPNSQPIYCETTVDNINWEQVFIKFTANSNYNVLWIYPQENAIENRASGLHFTNPELIDITNFSAGVNQFPIPPNCTVTIGPSTPNCGVTNAVFTWNGPNGQVITAPANQQIQVDASNAQNVGTWTLTMGVPSATITNSTCGLQGTVSATVNVNACVTPVPWPKVYYTWYPQLHKNNNGDIFASLWATGDLNQNINHSGFLPSPPNNNIHYVFPYGNTGVTNWAKTNSQPLYIMNSGAIQLISSNGSTISYCDGANGNTIPTPPLLTSSDIILAETSNGSFITQIGNSIYLKTTTGTTSVSVNTYGSYLPLVKFNPNTNRLFVYTDIHSFKVFDIINNNFVLVSNSPNNTNLWVVQIDNQNRVFANTINGLEQYNYLSNTFSPVTIANFPQASMFPMYSLRPYTEDRFMTINSAINKVYAVDLSLMSAKYISIIGEYHPESFTYTFVGNNVYVATCLNANSTVTIGTQNIPALPNSDQQSGFIAKLNLADFSSFQSLTTNQKPEVSSLKAFIYPNPTTTNLTLRITENDKQSLAAYSLTVTDKMGGVLLRQANYTSGRGVNISRLEKGVYFATITNNKNEKVTVAFSKL